MMMPPLTVFEGLTGETRFRKGLFNKVVLQVQEHYTIRALRPFTKTTELPIRGHTFKWVDAKWNDVTSTRYLKDLLAKKDSQS